MRPRLFRFLVPFVIAAALSATLCAQTSPVVTSGGVVNAASFLAPVAPGSLISIFGQNLSDQAYQATSLPLPEVLGNTFVVVNGVPVPLIYASPTQINAQLPAGILPGQALIDVSFGGLDSATISFTVAATAPGIFTTTQNQAIVFNQDGSLNTTAKPAAPGSIVTLFLTGAGAVSNLPKDGSPASASPPSLTPDTPTVTFGGLPGMVQFSGLSSCCVGLWQINVTIPVGAPAGNAIPVQVTLDGAASNQATLAINPPSPLDFSPLALSAAATVGANYQAAFITSGGTPPVTWTLGTGSGLTGLNLSTTGVLSGKPSASGSFSLPITAKDSLGVSITHGVSLTVNPAPTFATGLTLPTAMVGVAYSTQISVSGGTLPFTVVSAASSLLPGLSLSVKGSTLTLSGSPQGTASGTFGMMITVSDANGATASATFQLPLIAPLAITTLSPLPATSVDGMVSFQFAAAGGSGALTWSATGLPNNLTISSSGLLSGAISSSVSPGTLPLSVKVTDASGLSVMQTFPLVVNAAPVIGTTQIPAGILNTPYSVTLRASLGTAPYTWSVAGGSSLPSGLSLNASTGVISGTPASVGAFSFQVQVTDSAGATAAQPQPLTLNVSSSTLAFTAAAALPVAIVGVPYQTMITASGGAQPYNWTIAGNLPPGLTLNPLTGLLSGTLTSPGSNSFVFTVNLTDALGTPLHQQFQMTAIVIPPMITTPPMLGASLGYPYSRTLSVIGGVPPYTWTAGPDLGLIGGLTLSSAGQISGPAQAAGVFMFTVFVMDSAGSTTSQVFTLNVGSTLTIVTPSLPAAQAGYLYSYQMDAMGGVPPLVWSVPDVGGNLSVTPTGVVTGVPEEAYGPVNVAVQVNDQSGQVVNVPFGSLVVNITSPPAITTLLIPSGRVGVGYTYPLAATGGTTPYTWTVALGSLPPGLKLNNAQGIVSGTPTQSGTFNFVVLLSDANGFLTAVQYPMTIN